MYPPYSSKTKDSEPEDDPELEQDLLRLQDMGFTESEAREILYLCIPVERFIALVEVRKCPPPLALRILRP